jgi:23S rRNA-intervening sequence protein
LLTGKLTTTSVSLVIFSAILADRWQRSLAELETQILIALRRNYLSEPRANELLGRASELGRILNGLITSLKERTAA